MSTSLVQVRVDDELKKQATALYENLGMDLSTAIRLFLKRSLCVNGLPFEVSLEKDDAMEKALMALKKLNASAKSNGLVDMSLEDINKEIDAYRKGD